MWKREISKPRAAALCGGACPRSAPDERATCLPAAGAVARDATLRAHGSHRRRGPDAGDHRTGQRVRPLRLPEDHNTVGGSRLAGGQGSGAVHLAAGGTESAAETAATGAVVAERRVVRAAAAGAGQSRLGL